MPIKIQAAKAVAFQEHPVLDFVLVEPGKFDVTAKDLNVPSNFVKENRFLLDAYCLALLNIVCSIPQSDMTSFIDYQCSQLQVPVSWLNSLEQLIEENCELLESSKVKFRIQKLIICINDKLNDLKRKKTRLKSNLVNLDLIDNEDDEKVKFDFRAVKFDLNKLTSYDEKKAYLIELKADYLQKEPVMNSGKPLDTLIDIEMEKIDRLEHIKKASQSKSQVAKSNNTSKIPINGKVNVLVDAFFQMLYEIKIDNKPYLGCSPTTIAELISNNFIDKDGYGIPISTIRTILSPGKSDKRPSIDKKVKFKTLALFLLFSSTLSTLTDIQDIVSFVPC